MKTADSILIFVAPLAVFFNIWVWFRFPARRNKGRVKRFVARALSWPAAAVTFVVEIVGVSAYFGGWFMGRPTADLIGHVVYGVCFGLPALDDLLADDDHWRRFWSTAKNRVKWRMTLPAPAPVSSHA